MTLTPEQRTVLAEADRFARNELAPLAARMDDEEWWPGDLFARLGALGALGLTVPPELGGAGMDLFSAGLVAQAYGRWNPAVGLSWGAHENLCVNNLYRNGSEDQRRRYLPPLCSGEQVGALALTEPGAGSDALGGMATTAVRHGDTYVLNGTKLYITNAPIADVVLVYAKTEPAAGARGISAFIVEAGFPGFEVAQKLAKMGYRGSPTGELVLRDCEVPAANLLGDENAGVAVVMSGLDLERAFLAMGGLGLAERCLQLAVEHAATRRQFGRRLTEFQMVQAKLADMWLAVESTKTFCYRVLATAAGMGSDEGGRGEIHQLAAGAILLAAETATAVADEALQIHGGSGYMWEMEINRLYRAAKLMDIGAGTNEVRRMIIAEELLASSSAASR